MHGSIFLGFKKKAGISADGAEKLFKHLNATPIALGSSMVGSGAGLLLRSKFEDKLKDPRDRTGRDKLVAYAPLLGAIGGLAGGAGLARYSNKKFLTEFHDKKKKVLDFMDDVAGVAKREHGTDWSKSKPKTTSPGAIAPKIFPPVPSAGGADDFKSIADELLAKAKAGGNRRPNLDKLNKKMQDLAEQNRKIDLDELADKTEEIKNLLGITKKSSFNQGFQKSADLKKNVVLRDHQQKALERLDDNDGSLLLAHATGSGKTLTGIAAFEKRKKEGKAKRAIVVVPAALRENFAENGVKKFTDSSVSVYGPKGESKTKDIGNKSDSDYNVVSYELFREHGDKLLEDTGADTLIMDEIHKVRSDTGSTYNKIRELRPKFRQAMTLTGSVVNNQPNDVVPLMDITFKPEGHKLVSKPFFDKLFVQKDAKRYGFFNPKVEVQKNLKNKGQLGKYLKGKIDFISHKDLEKDLPKRQLENVSVMMSPEQTAIYNNNMSSVDPITRWKIRNNLPVGQKEARDAFSKLLQARQASTDHSIFDKRLQGTNPMEYSPKIKKIVEDAKAHLNEDKGNRTIIYGNLLKGQLEGVEKALKHENLPFSKFVGTGQEGVTSKGRVKSLDDFNKSKNRILVLSGAGAEGLDLKDTTMMQMVEGHYNPEKILQAESRIRRLGAFKDKPEEDRKITIKRYFSEPSKTGFSKAMAAVSKSMGGGQTGIDKWVYSVAQKKDDLNEQFRDTLKKTAGEEEIDELNLDDMSTVNMVSSISKSVGQVFGSLPGQFIGKRLEKGLDKDIEARIKQKLLDRGHEELTTKKHYPKILSESKIDETILDAKTGLELGVGGLGLIGASRLPGQIKSNIRGMIGKTPSVPKPLTPKGVVGRGLALGGAIGLSVPIMQYYAKKKILDSALSGKSPQLDTGIDRYVTKLRKRMERKYKSSKGFVREFETKQELGIDPLA